jgi:hypothetical protein
VQQSVRLTPGLAANFIGMAPTPFCELRLNERDEFIILARFSGFDLSVRGPQSTAKPRRCTMAQAKSKKNARLPDKACGKVCGGGMISRTSACG